MTVGQVPMIAPNSKFTEGYLFAWVTGITGPKVRFCMKDICFGKGNPVAESVLVKNAVRKRQFEFAAGRKCIHSLLEQFGVTDQFIDRGIKGEPLLPMGFKGSISHDSNRAVAVLTDRPSINGIGLDLINYRQQGKDLPLSLVATEHESTAFARYLQASEVPSFDDETLTLALFSLKESAIKVISPQTNHYIDMLELKFHVEGGQLYIAYRDYPVWLRLFLTVSEQEIFTLALDRVSWCA